MAMKTSSVQLYYLPLCGACEKELFLRLLNALPERARKKIERLPFSKAVPPLYAELLLLKVLQEATGVPAKELQISLGEHGKPYLENASLHFNCSHTQSAVAVALFDQPVGVDIEKIRPVRSGLERRFFAPSEIEFVEKSDSGRKERLIEIWTKKEAYVKELGVGLSCPFPSFSVLEEPLLSSIRTYKTDGNYLSVSCSAPAPIRFIEISQKDVEFI